MTVDIKAELAAAKKRVELLETLAALDADPVASKLAREMFGGKSVKRVAKDKKPKATEFGFDKLKKWFDDSKKESTTIAEMAEAIGVKPPSIRLMIYTTNRDRFQKVGKVEGKRDALYAIK